MKILNIKCAWSAVIAEEITGHCSLYFSPTGNRDGQGVSTPAVRCTLWHSKPALGGKRCKLSKRAKRGIYAKRQQEASSPLEEQLCDKPTTPAALIMGGCSICESGTCKHNARYKFTLIRISDYPIFSASFNILLKLQFHRTGDQNIHKRLSQIYFPQERRKSLL